MNFFDRKMLKQPLFLTLIISFLFSVQASGVDPAFRSVGLFRAGSIQLSSISLQNRNFEQVFTIIFENALAHTPKSIALGYSGLQINFLLSNTMSQFIKAKEERPEQFSIEVKNIGNNLKYFQLHYLAVSQEYPGQMQLQVVTMNTELTGIFSQNIQVNLSTPFNLKNQIVIVAYLKTFIAIEPSNNQFSLITSTSIHNETAIILTFSNQLAYTLQQLEYYVMVFDLSDCKRFMSVSYNSFTLTQMQMPPYQIRDYVKGSFIIGMEEFKFNLNYDFNFGINIGVDFLVTKNSLSKSTLSYLAFTYATCPQTHPYLMSDYVCYQCSNPQKLNKWPDGSCQRCPTPQKPYLVEQNSLCESTCPDNYGVYEEQYLCLFINQEEEEKQESTEENVVEALTKNSSNLMNFVMIGLVVAAVILALWLCCLSSKLSKIKKEYSIEQKQCNKLNRKDFIYVQRVSEKCRYAKDQQISYDQRQQDTFNQNQNASKDE